MIVDQASESLLGFGSIGGICSFYHYNSQVAGMRNPLSDLFFGFGFDTAKSCW